MHRDPYRFWIFVGFNVIGSEKDCCGAFISNCKEIGINRHFQRRLLLACIVIRGQTNMQRKDEVEEAVQKDMRLQMRGHPRMKQS